MSIVFHKRFIVFLNDSVMETNSRMRNLLKICNLECLIYSKNMNYEEIDWELVDKKLDKAREKSKDYLANFDFLKIKK